MNTSIILKKLNLTERGAAFILRDKALCNHIMEETPIHNLAFAKKYDIAIYTINKLIQNGIISHFSNKYFGSRGCKVFIFEEEALNVLGKGIYNPSCYAEAEKTVNLFIKLSSKLYNNHRDIAIIEDVFIKKQTIDKVADKNNITKERLKQIINKSTRKSIRFIEKLKKDEELTKQIAEKEVHLQNLNNLIKQLESETIKSAGDLKNLQLLSTPINELDISVRAFICLKSAEIQTLGDLIQINSSDLLKIRNMGKKTQTEIIEVVHGFKLRFKNEE